MDTMEPSSSSIHHVTSCEGSNSGTTSNMISSPKFLQIDSEKSQQPIFKVVHGSKPPITKKKSRSKPEGPLSELYDEEEGPRWHEFNNPMITPPIIASKLQNFFKDLPIHDAPDSSEEKHAFDRKKIQEFVGGGMDDEEFAELEEYCNPENLRTGKEISMSTDYPLSGLLTKASFKDQHDKNYEYKIDGKSAEPNLNILRKMKERQSKDKQNSFMKSLKYRGARILPFKDQANSESGAGAGERLCAGRDTLFKVRVYRPFSSKASTEGEKQAMRRRHSLFEFNLMVSGRTPLTGLRDRVACRNDLDTRLDVSARPHHPPAINAKTVFPSGFLFINNVFYVDRRGRCSDQSAAVRRWARDRGMGDFPVRDMATHCLDTVPVRLAHPEVYVHQGNCEHVFVISEIRLVSVTDPLRLSSYPFTTLIAQTHTRSCTTCMEYGARWLVTHCKKIPFNPAFLCNTCFMQYLYVDGKKICDFKAYHYTENEVNVGKFQGFTI